MFTFDGWVTRVTFELHWALETRLHASALNSELQTGVNVLMWSILQYLNFRARLDSRMCYVGKSVLKFYKTIFM